MDNFFTGTRRNIEHLLSHPRFELLRHDITFPLYVEVDRIYNLACPASPIHYRNDPVQTPKTSVNGSINMLGLAKRLKARILQASRGHLAAFPPYRRARRSSESSSTAACFRLNLAADFGFVVLPRGLLDRAAAEQDFLRNRQPGIRRQRRIIDQHGTKLLPPGHGIGSGSNEDSIG